ncbi:hypothetical protein P4S72_26530 [Vibrio sp. PP-XX7]
MNGITKTKWWLHQIKRLTRRATKNITLYFRESLKRFGLEDILLLDTNGNVVYSVKKHIDFGDSVTSAFLLAQD